ncbi:MAG: TVP38/TMEM64 family protein [Spirochaetota bacterium]|nr:TVP38/TMEM64 family protein [Spirochaetota bacterium]
MNKNFRTILIAVIIIAGLLAAARFTALGEVLNPQRIAENRDTLIEYVRDNFLISALLFVLLYIIVVALSIPGATVLSLLGGFFYGPLIGVVLINIGATGGAFLVFLAARFVIGNLVQQKYGERLEKFNREIQENGKNYLLTLRLIPVFPFFLINIFAGVTAVPAVTFLWTTALGIIPGSFVYAYLGYTGARIEPGESLISSEILIALVLLGMLSLLPVIARKIRSRRKEGV